MVVELEEGVTLASEAHHSAPGLGGAVPAAWPIVGGFSQLRGCLLASHPRVSTELGSTRRKMQ